MIYIIKIQLTTVSKDGKRGKSQALAIYLADLALGH